MSDKHPAKVGQVEALMMASDAMRKGGIGGLGRIAAAKSVADAIEHAAELGRQYGRMEAAEECAKQPTDDEELRRSNALSSLRHFDGWSKLTTEDLGAVAAIIKRAEAAQKAAAEAKA